MADISNLLDVFVTFGREGGKGADSIIKAAMFATGAAAAKLMTEKDAGDAYAAYRMGFDGEVTLSDNFVLDEKVKGQVSCFRTFLKPEVVKNGEIHGRALQLRTKIEAANRKHSAYNGLVAVNRAQIKKGNVALTNAEITEVLSKPAAGEEKSKVAKLEAGLKALQKLDDEVGGLLDAIAVLERQIQAAKAEELAANAEDGTDEDVRPSLESILQNTNGVLAGVTLN